MPEWLLGEPIETELIGQGGYPSRTHRGYVAVWISDAIFLVCRDCGSLVPPFKTPVFDHDMFHETHPTQYQDED